MCYYPDILTIGWKCTVPVLPILHFLFPFVRKKGADSKGEEIGINPPFKGHLGSEPKD